MKMLLLSVAAATTLASVATAQRDSATAVGTWRGKSVCLVRPSACNDESVVYRITRTAVRDSVSMDALKIVAGREESMGVLGCRVSATAALTCAIPNGVWKFQVRGDSLVGELVTPNGTRFRDVRAMRAP